jgi:hypothetical protein
MKNAITQLWVVVTAAGLGGQEAMGWTALVLVILNIFFF